MNLHWCVSLCMQEMNNTSHVYICLTLHFHCRLGADVICAYMDLDHYSCCSKIIWTSQLLLVKHFHLWTFTSCYVCTFVTTFIFIAFSLFTKRIVWYLQLSLWFPCMNVTWLLGVSVYVSYTWYLKKNEIMGQYISCFCLLGSCSAETLESICHSVLWCTQKTNIYICMTMRISKSHTVKIQSDLVIVHHTVHYWY